jgi:hypothetical protein
MQNAFPVEQRPVVDTPSPADLAVAEALWWQLAAVPLLPANQTRLAKLTDILARALAAARAEALKNAHSIINSRLNAHLIEMKEGYDDSIVGFNEAWEVVSTFFRENKS